MLFKLLRLFGLDVPAKIDAATAGLELRLKETTADVKKMAQDAAVIVALSTFAAVAGAAAIGVALIALYRWIAEAFGPYAALGSVGGVFIAASILFATAAALKGKSSARDEIKLPRYSLGAASADSDHLDAAMSAPSDHEHGAERRSDARTLGSPSSSSTPTASTLSASDLAEPLAFFLTNVVKYPSIGHPAMDKVVGNLGVTARGAADEAIDRAADIVRHGDRTQLFAVLTGAAFVGWLLARNTRPQSPEL
jgi:hypothetical protein